MNTPSAKKNYLYNLSYQILTVFVPLITTSYVARTLGPEGNGQYSYMLATVTYFAMFAQLGIISYGQIKIAANREDRNTLIKLSWEIIIAKFLTSGICCIVYIAVGIVLHRPKIYFLFLLAIFTVAADVSWLFQGLEEFKITVIRNLVVKLISTVLIFAFVHSIRNLDIYIVIVQGSLFLGNLTLWPSLVKRIGLPYGLKNLQFRKHWKYSIFYFLSAAATTIYTVLDKSMIGLITGDVFQNGYYDQAHKIIQMVVMLVTSVSMVMMSKSALLFKKNRIDDVKLALSKSIQFILLLSMPIIIGINVTADILIPLYLGEGYDECIPILKVFSILVLAIGLNNAIGKQILMASEKHKQYNIGVFIGASSNVILNAILIPRLGALGAAIASVSAELIILAVFSIYSKEYIRFGSTISIALRYFVFSCIMGAVVRSIQSNMCVSPLFSLLYSTVTGCIVYGVLILISRDNLVFSVLKRNY